MISPEPHLLSAPAAQAYSNNRMADGIDDPDLRDSLDAQLLFWSVVEIFEKHPHLGAFDFSLGANADSELDALREAHWSLFGVGEQLTSADPPPSLMPAKKELHALFEAFIHACPETAGDVLAAFGSVERDALVAVGGRALGAPWEAAYREAQLQVLPPTSAGSRPRM